MIYQVTIRSSFDPTALKSGEAETNAYFDRMVVKARQAADQIEKDMARIGPKIVAAAQKATLTPTAPNITTSVGSGQAQAAQAAGQATQASVASSVAAATASQALANANNNVTTSLNSGVTPALGAASAAAQKATQNTKEMGVAQVALGVALGEFLVHAAERFIERVKSLVEYVTMTAARTEELGLALGAVARANNITSASIQGQENAIRKLNITTSDARAVLSEMIQSQLDTTQATKLATAAQDLAVISGRSSVDELRMLTHGITTMQSEVLRTAGVFTTADEAYKKYTESTGRTTAQMSIQEKQQAILNEVLLQGARSVGVYDAAMFSATKQIRSMERVQEEAAVAVGNFFQGPLLAGLEIEKEVLEWITKYPGAMILLTAAVGALSVAFLALNATTAAWINSLTIGLIRAIPNAIAQIGTLVAAITSGSAIVAADLVAATAGLAAIGIAIGLVIYAVTQYSSTTEELVEVDSRLLNKTNALIAANKEDLEWLIKGKTAVESEVEARAKTESILLRINPLKRQAILNATTEAEKTRELTKAIQDQNVELDKQRARQLSLALAAGAAGVRAEKEAERLQDEALKERERLINQPQSVKEASLGILGSKGIRSFQSTTATWNPMTWFADYTEAVKANEAALKEQSDTVVKGSAAVQQAAQTMAEASRVGKDFGARTTEQAEAWIKAQRAIDGVKDANRDLIPEEKRLAEEMVSVNLAAERRANAFLGVKGIINSYNEAVKAFKPPEIDFSKSEDFLNEFLPALSKRLDDLVQKETEAGDKVGRSHEASKALAMRQAKEMLASTDGLIKGATGTKAAYDGVIGSLSPLMQESLKRVVQMNAEEKGWKSLTQEVDYNAEAMQSARESLEKLSAMLPDLRKGGGALFDLEFTQQNLAQESSQLQEILRLRRLYGLERKDVPESLAGREAEIRSLGRLTAARNEIVTATEAQQAAEVALAVLIQKETIPLVDAETRAHTKIQTAILERKNAELDLTASVRAAVAARTAAMKGEQESLQDTRTEYQKLQLASIQKAEEARLFAIRANLELGIANKAPEIQLDMQNTVNMNTDKIATPVNVVAQNVMTVATNVTTVATKVQTVIDQLVTIVAKMNEAPTIPQGVYSGSEGSAPTRAARTVLGSVMGDPRFDAEIARAAATQPQIEQKFLRNLMKATLYREGGGRDHPANSVGAEGWMQMIPETARANKVNDVHNLQEVLIGSANLFAKRIAQVGYDSRELTATYFAGPGGGNRGAKTREYAESQSYVMDVAMGKRAAQPGELFSIPGAPTAAVNPLMTKDVDWHYKFTPEQFNALKPQVQSWIAKDAATKAELDEVKKRYLTPTPPMPLGLPPPVPTPGGTPNALPLPDRPTPLLPVMGELPESESYQAANREALYKMIGGVPKVVVAKAAHAQSGRNRRRPLNPVIPKALLPGEFDLGPDASTVPVDQVALNLKARKDIVSGNAAAEILQITTAQDRLNDAIDTETEARKKLAEAQVTNKDLGNLTLEQQRVEAAFADRARIRIAEDAKAATAASIVERDNAQLRVRGTEEYTRAVVEGARAREAAEGQTLKKIADQEIYLQKLRANDPTTLRQLETTFKDERISQAVSNTVQIKQLEDQIAHAGEDSADRYRIAWLKAYKDVLDADTKAAESRAASEAKIADSTVYHAEQANAKVLEFLASQKSVTQTVADFKIAVIQSGFDSIDRFFEKLGGHALTAKKLLADILASLTKMAVSKVLAALMGVGTGGGGGGNVFSGGPSGGGFGGVIKNFLGGGGSNVVGSSNASVGGLSAIFNNILGLPSGGGGGGGQSSGGQDSIQTFLNAINSPAPASSGAAAALGGLPFLGAFGAPQSLTQTGLSAQGVGIQKLVGALTGKAPFMSSGGVGAGGSIFGAGGLTGMLGPLLPLLGIGGGAYLGSPSKTGSILGGVGGGLLGLGALAGLGSMGLAGGLGASAIGFAGSLGLGLGATSGPLMGLSTLIGNLFGGAGSSLGMFMGVAGPVALIAAPLIIGAIVLAKNAARRRDEKTRDKLMGDSLSQLTELLDAVQHKRVDNEAAVLAAIEVRKQYVAQAELLKDSKTKRIALQDVSRVDAMVARIRGATDLNIRHQEIAARIVPEFAEGGPVLATQLIAVSGDETLLKPKHVAALGGHKVLRNAGVPVAGAGQANMVPVSQLTPTRPLPHGGRIAVPDLGRDTHVLEASAHDVIINKKHRAALGGATILHAAGVPGYAGGGVVRGYGMGGQISAFNAYSGGMAASVIPFDAHGGSMAAPLAEFNAYGGITSGPTGTASLKAANWQNTPISVPPSAPPRISGVGQISSGRPLPSAEQFSGSGGGGGQTIVIQELHIDIDEGKLIARGAKTSDGRTAINMVVRQFVIDRK